MQSVDTLEGFLEDHEPISCDASIAPGTIVANWRITAYLGRGGSAEVYRALHTSLPLEAAIKVLVRGDGSRLARFRREAELLSSFDCPELPRFFGLGEVDGMPCMAMELLEPSDLPHSDRDVASFLIAVAEGVNALHVSGFVHRDLKPQNIMRRKDGLPVIIDLGLAKRISGSQSAPQSDTLSIVDGKHVGLGTPHYAAPEQFSADEITPAADIHALGKIADECFDGKPPRSWRRIIERATSSIPARRYPSVVDFIHAVRHRNILRMAAFCSAVLLLLGLIFAGVAVWIVNGGGESLKWPLLCEHGEIESVETVYTPYVSKVHGDGLRVSYVTNIVEGVIINLRKRTLSLKEPVDLAPGEYRIVGPGRIDVALSGPSNAVVRLKNCVLNNMTTVQYPENQICYVMEGGAYLNFANLDENPQMCRSVRCAEECQGGNDFAVEFRGPLILKELNKKRRDERDDILREEAERINKW